MIEEPSEGKHIHAWKNDHNISYKNITGEPCSEKSLIDITKDIEPL